MEGVETFSCPLSLDIKYLTPKTIPVMEGVETELDLSTDCLKEIAPKTIPVMEGVETSSVLRRILTYEPLRRLSPLWRGLRPDLKQTSLAVPLTPKTIPVMEGVETPRRW